MKTPALGMLFFALSAMGASAQPAVLPYPGPHGMQAPPDPRQALSILLGAFQNCGPPQAFQILGVQLFQMISMQTGGSGCYPQLQQLGSPTNFQVTGQQQLPAGPVYAVRVQHQTNQATDWYIGISQHTGKVEYLNFQITPSSAPPPRVGTGPAPNPPSASGGSPPSTQPPTAASSDGCRLYPAMCQ